MSVEKYDAREHFKDVIHESNACALCQGPVDAEKKDRGIIEFMDGWFWICSKCRNVVGPAFDHTQCEKRFHVEIPPYYQRSRRWWGKWFEKEYQITIKQHSTKE